MQTDTPTPFIAGSPVDAEHIRRVVVIGSGLAGLCAALEARANGARVQLLEMQSEDRRGGNSVVSGGAFLAPSSDCPQGRDDFVASLVASTRGNGNAQLFAVMAERVLDDLQWLVGLGAEFQPPYACAPPYQCSVHSLAPSQFMGTARFMNALYDELDRRGVLVHYGVRAEKLVLSASGAVCGVATVCGDTTHTFEADAVVLAAGGYSGNKDLLTSLVGPEAQALALRGVDWLTGTGIEIARHVGAHVSGQEGLDSLHIAAVAPTQPRGGNPSRAIPYSVAINALGERYVDESKGYVANGKAALKQPGQVVAIVFDSAIASASGVRTAMTTYRNMGLPIVEAGDIEELAAAIHVPVSALRATLTRFNASIADGKAPDALPPKAAWAHPVEVPPYYALYPCRPAITLTFGGVAIDTQARVMTATGQTIPGLFAAGEMAGCLFHHDYLGGGSLSNCLTMGRIAGNAAAQEPIQ